MLDAETLRRLEAFLATWPMIAVETSDENIRDHKAHSHSVGQIIGSSGGLLSVTTHKGTWVVPTTHCVWIPPGEIHATHSHGAFCGWGLFVNEKSSARLPESPRTMRADPLLRALIHRLAELPLDSAHRSRRENLANVIFDEVVDLPAVQLELAAPADARLRKITDEIVADLSAKRGLPELAKWAGISSRSLSRRFVAETGLTFTAWRQRARLLKALEMLVQGVSVTTVSLDLGYENVGGFISLFRRTFGVTPREYALAGQVTPDNYRRFNLTP